MKKEIVDFVSRCLTSQQLKAEHQKLISAQKVLF